MNYKIYSLMSTMFMCHNFMIKFVCTEDKQITEVNFNIKKIKSLVLMDLIKWISLLQN